jgi:hypothetical protein
MFFATKQWVARAFAPQLQVWKTTKEIEIIFLVDYLTSSSKAFSSLPILYKNIFPADSNLNLTDLDIKHHDILRRNKFVKKLFDEYGISGWFTSLENNGEVEICLFDAQSNSKQLILVDEIFDGEKKIYYKDSLQKLKLFPTKYFFEKTEEKIKHEYRNTYKLYKQMMNSRIKEDIENGGERLHVQHSCNTLRTKLKI